jgi:P27 family predicted phage terminase small subunit
MGKRGPKKTPTNILQLRGSWRGDARGSEPVAVDGIPDCPEWLVGEAKAEWDRQVPDLSSRKLMSKSYRVALAMFCEAWGEYVQAVAFIAQHGWTTVGVKGGIVKHPMVEVKNASFDRAMKMGQQFGFSPSAKAGIQIDEQEKPSGKSRFFAS